MDWVEGETLDKYIRKHLDDQYELSLLAYQFSRLAMWLMPQPFAHGDLKPDNILVKSDGTLVLVDYDGMYVPAMKGQKARELGSPDFRHPSRTEIDFDEHIDDFSLASILLSLKAISLQPSLLEEYGASDRLLFSEMDYRNLSESKVMDALKSLMQDAELASLYSLFILALSQNNLSQVSFRLFNLSRPEKPQYEEENLSTEVTEEDLANAWTDEYGVMYSADRKRLLKASDSFKNNRYLIEDGVLVVCDKAFNLSDLHSIILPNSVISIGNLAFANNHNMEYCNIPSSVKNMGANNPWVGCVKMKNLYCLSPHYKIENGILYSSDYRIAYALIYWNPTFSNISIDNRTKKIAAYAFEHCFLAADKYGSLIKKIELGSVNYIGNAAFFNCKGLINIHIPESIKAIGERAFSGCSALVEITVEKNNKRYYSNGSNAIIEQSSHTLLLGCKNTIIPDEVVTIGDSAFLNCSGLTSIHIPDSVTTIGESAFQRCSALMKITVGENNIKYYSNGSNAIIEQSSHTLLLGCMNTIIPDGVVSIGDSAFCDCKGLTNIHIPDSVTTIGDRAFLNCSGLTSIQIPKGVTSIGEWAFSCCSGLTNIQIPESVSTIGKSAFSFCRGLTNIQILEGVTTIGEWAFSDCSALTNIYIPDSVTTIGDDAFSDCCALTKIIIPVGSRDKFGELLPGYKDKLVEQDEENLSTEVTKGDLANAWTDEYGVKYSADRKRLLKAPQNLKSYSIANETEVICNFAFALPSPARRKLIQSESEICSLYYISLPQSIKVIGKYAFKLQDKIESIEIPKGVIEIKDGAFEGCKSLTRIVIPDTVTKIGVNPFDSCFCLEHIICQSPFFVFNNGLLLSCDMTLLVSCINTTDSIVVPNSVKTIGDRAFSGCSHLKQVIIPDTVIHIGEEAFSFCESLTHLTIPNSVKTIGKYAFGYCFHLKNINLSTHLDEVVWGCFFHCYALEKVNIPSNVKKIDSKSFSGCTSLNKIVIPNSVVEIGDEAFRDCSSVAQVTIPNSVKIIGCMAFSDCSSMTNIFIPDSILKIGAGTFYGCHALIKISIPVGSKKKFVKMCPDIFIDFYSDYFMTAVYDKWNKDYPEYTGLFVEQNIS